MNIKELRLSTGMTQKEFAEYFSIPQKTIENWEQRARKAPDYVIELVKYKIEKENKTMRKEINIMNEVDNKYREYLETTPDLTFYLENGNYYVKTDMHYEKLGTWEDLIYFLDCQILE